MVLQKLLQELHRLLPGDIGAKVAIATEQLVQPIHSSGGGEAGGVVPEVLAVFPEGHTSPKQTSHLIPLKEDRQTTIKTNYRESKVVMNLFVSSLISGPKGSKLRQHL